MSEIRPPTPEEISEILQRNSGVLLGVGVVQILLGVAAVIVPQVATVVGVEFLAVMLCISGIAQGVLTFRVSGWKGTSLMAVGALVSLAAGIMILTDPQGGAVAITLLLAIVCGVEGIARVALGMGPAGAGSRGNFIVSGLAGVVLGILLAIEWPDDAVWAIGLLLGINLLMGGMSLVAVAMAARRGDVEKPA